MANVEQRGDRAKFVIYPSHTPSLHVVSVEAPSPDGGIFRASHYLSTVDLYALSLAMSEYGRKLGG